MKRLICIFTALAVSIMVLSLPVFADDDGIDYYYASQLTYIAEFTSGRITWQEFQERSKSLTDELFNDHTVGGVIEAGAKHAANSIQALTNKFGVVVDEYGDKAWQYLQGWVSGFFDDYKVLSETSSFDMKGGTAVLKKVTSDGWYYVYYSDSYGILDYVGDNESRCNCDYYLYEVYDSSGNLRYSYPGRGHLGTTTYYNGTVFLYGDWRWSDTGKSAPTDDEYVSNESFDFSKATDKELEDLLNDILEALELSNPDLSSIEGLLQAIYYRLGTLDSDDDNAILTEINASILSLAKDGNSEYTELIEALSELKEAIKNSKGDYDSKYFEDMRDYLKDISGTLKGLAFIEVADNFLDLTDSESKLFDAYADLIPLLVSKIGFASVSQVIFDMNVVIFTDSAPSDLTVEIFGEEYTLLSSSMFTGEAIRYIKMGKTFVSVILVYIWCLKMRKLLAGG